MSYGRYLRELLAPLRLYDLEAPFNGGELNVQGGALDGVDTWLAELRRELPHTFFLVPGYGAQGGTAEDVQYAFDANGHGAIVNSSRGIMCAWQKTGKGGAAKTAWTTSRPPGMRRWPCGRTSAVTSPFDKEKREGASVPIQAICKILSVERLNADAVSLWLQAGAMADQAQVGQFVNIKCGEGLLLRRPISICRAGDGKLNVVFEVRGEGTAWLARRSAGEELDVMGPLGHGFTYPQGKVLVAGGGIGVPPMLPSAPPAAPWPAWASGGRTRPCWCGSLRTAVSRSISPATTAPWATTALWRMWWIRP